jgi:hypothetical protein
MLAGLPLISKEQEKGDSIVMKSFCHRHGPRFCFRGRWVIEPKKTFVEQMDVQEGTLPAADVVQQLLASVIEHQRWLHLHITVFLFRTTSVAQPCPPFLQLVDAVQRRFVARIHRRVLRRRLRCGSNRQLEEAVAAHG